MTHGMFVSGSGLRIVLGMMFVMLLADPLAAQSNNAFDATTGTSSSPTPPRLISARSPLSRPGSGRVRPRARLAPQWTRITWSDTLSGSKASIP